MINPNQFFPDNNSKLVTLNILENVWNFFLLAYSTLAIETSDDAIRNEIDHHRSVFHNIYSEIKACITNIDFSQPHSVASAKQKIAVSLPAMEGYLMVNPKYITDHPIGPDYHQYIPVMAQHLSNLKQNLKSNGLFDMMQLSPEDQLSRNAHESKRLIESDDSADDNQFEPVQQRRRGQGH